MASAGSGAPYHKDREVEQLAVPSGPEERTAGRVWKRRIVYGAIVAALIAVFYFAGTSDKPGVEKSMEETEPARIELGKAETEQGKAQAEPPRPAEKLRAPLELDIPPNMPQVDIDVYVVVKGDTLWSISQRFTGSSFNYPRIAGENKIADPDLIFLGQRISLRK